MDLLRTPVLTRTRIGMALAVAVAADGLQIMLLHFGWLFADEAIDIAAALLITWLLGFHPLLIPTFVAEFIPVVDMLPTWTGCVAVVIALRKRQQRSQASVSASPPPPSPPKSAHKADVIDI